MTYRKVASNNVLVIRKSSFGQKVTVPKRFYYRRPRDSYYTMKNKQEPVRRFTISWYTWAKILFTV